MEEFGICRFDIIGNAARKKRTQTSRRPKPESQPLIDSRHHSSSSSTTPPSGRSAFSNKRSSEGVLAPANWKNTSKVKESFEAESINANIYSGRNGESQSLEQSGVLVDSLGNENKVKKVKLKVGGVTRTIHANSTTNGSTNNSRFSENSRLKHKLQGNSEQYHSILEKRTGLQGVPWKDFCTSGFSLGKESSSMGKISEKNAFGKQGEKSETARKSKRVPKRRVLDEEIGEDYEDDEIRYLEKLKTPKIAARYKDNEKSSRKQQRLSSLESVGALKLAKNGKKKSSLDRASEDTGYEEEEDLASEGELEGNNRKKQKKESVDVLMDSKREMTLTTRQRALQSSRDGSTSAANLIEFPNGLPPAPSRKQKEKLTELEQQLKKAEAAQKRRIQVENAERESQAEAIRKILGQDSSRKKREEKIKKRQEELAQEKAANALTLPSNTIRCVMGPTGTVMTFSNDMGLPGIFESKPCSYPPPREKCAGPSCSNPYKYRDSKSMLPLCSLQCYKTVQEQMQAEGSC
ncbi:calponin homology domain-containing protein DDB_G0272472 isoform X2 [Ricinus communis]|uniref:calponin homology domain-containing protein DDB_G0272472 isoform X2 n=1 Tax=Ricinus communis TaxID=3988 RepID=UPI00201A7435|nr:calponin homology domain-containing protein DDB_G0272472 isoform X2 [Ricinus communis]